MKEEGLGILLLAETQVNIASMAPHNYAALIFSSGSKMAGLYEVGQENDRIMVIRLKCLLWIQLSFHVWLYALHSSHMTAV